MACPAAAPRALAGVRPVRSEAITQVGAGGFQVPGQVVSGNGGGTSWNAKGDLVLSSFSPLSYPRPMTEPDPKLTLATPDDLADTLSFALRHEGRKSQHRGAAAG